MIETLQNIDASLLLWFNGLHNNFFDLLMFTISNRLVWIPMYATIVVVGMMNYRFRLKLLYFLAFFGIAFALTDQICSTIIRPLVCRPRPTQPDSPIFHLVHIVYGETGGHYGFPSCHSANSFMLATLIALFFRKRSLTIFAFCWATIHSYSRIYMGVHYPGDIIVGGIVGVAVAFGVYEGFSYIHKFREREVLKKADAIMYVGLLTFASIIVYTIVQLWSI